MPNLDNLFEPLTDAELATLVGDANLDDWDADEACNEMADLFAQADAIMAQDHYQD